MSVNSSPQTVALIEPNAARLGGHWTPSLAGLSRAAANQGRQRLVVVALGGIHESTRARVEEAGAAVVTAPRGPLPALWRLCAWFFHKCARVAYRAGDPRSLSTQLTLLSRCFFEAASLMTAARCASGGERPTCVILTSNGGLVGLAARLSRTPHLRCTHEIDSPERGPLRLLARAGAGAERCVTALCPTEWVAERTHEVAPGADVRVVPYALRDAVERIDPGESEPARRRLGLDPTRPTVVLVGGWWAYKDNRVVLAALERVARPLNLVVAGWPVDADVLERMSGLPAVSVTALVDEIDDATLRVVYAAADFTLVSRVGGMSKESGLVLDAVRYGVPLVISDNDAALTQKLRDARWAALFATGDPASLAAVLDRVGAEPLPRPDADAARSFGLRTGAEMLELFVELGAEAAERCRGR